MATKKKAKAKTGSSGKKVRERAVSTNEAQLVVEKLKSGKSSVMAEARRLGCYHATLRKALRAAIGDAAYSKVMGGKRDTKPAKKIAKTAAKKPKSRVRARPPKPAAATASPEAATDSGVVQS